MKKEKIIMKGRRKKEINLFPTSLSSLSGISVVQEVSSIKTASFKKSLFLPLTKILCPPEYEIFPWQRWLRPRRPVSGWPSWRTARTRSYGQSPSSWSTEDTSVIILDLIFWRSDLNTLLCPYVRYNSYLNINIRISKVYCWFNFRVCCVFFLFKIKFADFVVFLLWRILSICIFMHIEHFISNRRRRKLSI